MFLEKLEVQGFKSFANKNALVFPGFIDEERRGITAVVGPNGSGKSNVADAVRWALGEQSMKTLRGKKGEDVIFSGSDKKGKLGMAEVSLHLNNEDGGAPVDLSQIVLTRRLYRNGDSEYLLNNKKVRLSDVQMFLAKCKFGQKTYSVIGQGMVEGFLSTSLAERKEFFDEATGVKQFQIKRDEALNKLRQSHENLSQAHMLLIEIEPRLKSLTRQVNKLNKRSELETELKESLLLFYRRKWHDLNDEFNKFNKELLTVEKEKMDKDKKHDVINQDLARLEKESSVDEEFNKQQKDLSELQNRKNDINKKMARLEAELEIELESRGQFDLSFLNNRLSETKISLTTLENDLESSRSGDNKDELKLKEINLKISDNIAEAKKANKELSELSSQSGNKTEIEIYDKMKEFVNRLESAENQNDLQELKKLIKEIKKEIKIILGSEESDDVRVKISSFQDSLTKLNQEKETLFLSKNELSTVLAVKNERVKIQAEKVSEIKQEISDLQLKIEKAGKKIDKSELQEALKKRGLDLVEVEKEINSKRGLISSISQREEEKRNNLFSLQKKLNESQLVINSLSNKLNETKVAAARRETKLEEMEFNIRKSLGSLREVRELRITDEFDVNVLEEKISNIRKQLEHIGGIDPEVEGEYNETKERFDFLDKQATDLSLAINSFEKIIKELDITIKEIFDKEFKIISKKFEEYFAILFNGGKAKLMKVMEQDEKKEDGREDFKKENNLRDPDDSLRRIKFLQKHNATGLAGIEIQATPPGKKIGSISMLSGGERALTAIALISAIISANPSPFVVLDEVDAALDESNSERLAKILDDLSHKTQFIIITHNRAPMRRANILYGVTMGDDGISKLLSIKLEDTKSR